MLVVTVTGELPISKDIEDLLKGAKTSIFIYRLVGACLCPLRHWTDVYTQGILIARGTRTPRLPQARVCPARYSKGRR